MHDLQSDLFAAPPVAGFSTAPGIVTPKEEAALIAAIDAIDLTPFRFQGWLGKRVTASFGWSYDFDTGGFARGQPIPDVLLPLRTRAATFANLKPDTLAQALVIRYDPGAGIGWHRDRPQFDHVLGISLGSPATLRLRKRRSDGFDRANVPLEPRSIYHLQDEVRHEWEHSIAAMAVPRWSITFRTLSGHGR